MNESFEASSRPLLRSLIQKAVRRGATDLVEKVAVRLAQGGDSGWLQTRAGVIVFEECWPNGAELLQRPALDLLKEVSGLEKNKEAAGLGSMAHAAATGDASALQSSPNPVAVKIVAASLTRTADFFKWLEKQSSQSEKRSIFIASRLCHSRATWPWDKAFATAGGYLACSSDVPKLKKLTITKNAIQCPLWVAVDKHTPQGRIALRKAAIKIGVPVSQLEWAGFYFESALSATQPDGLWWEAEMNWRLRKVGLSQIEAQSLWSGARDDVRQNCESAVEMLAKSLSMSGD